MTQGNDSANEPGVSGLDISGTPVEGGAHLPSAGAGYSDQQLLNFLTFLEWVIHESPSYETRFEGKTYEDIAREFLELRASGQVGGS